MKIGAFKTLVLTCAALCGQHALNAQSFAKEASVSQHPDGTVTIRASSPRPLWQALESVRLRYGWTIDYEDPIYPSSFIKTNMGGRRMLTGGSFSSEIKEPANSSKSEEKRLLTDLVEKYNDQSAIKYRVVQISNTRFDLSPASPSPMDQPVEIDGETRSLRAELDAILAAYTRATGIRAVQGGLVDTAMEQQQISLKHTEPIPVRQLLNEVLSHSAIQRNWLLAYEPDGDYVALGIRTTEKWTTDQSGATTIRMIQNPRIVASKSN